MAARDRPTSKFIRQDHRKTFASVPALVDKTNWTGFHASVELRGAGLGPHRVARTHRQS